MPGVIRTRVGYAGGTTPDPTYHNLGGHSEAIQIEYDPSQISYEELLDVFWNSHTPTAKPYSRQYMSIVFYHNQEQKRLALESKGREAAKGTDPIYTEIVSASEFYPAEAYHQKYWLRNRPALMKEFQSIYADDEDFVASTAAARVNGYVAGYSTLETLEAGWQDLDLPPEASERLLRTLR
jgi:methionine-S-sulfoxide reductase